MKSTSLGIDRTNQTLGFRTESAHIVIRLLAAVRHSELAKRIAPSEMDAAIQATNQVAKVIHHSRIPSRARTGRGTRINGVLKDDKFEGLSSFCLQSSCLARLSVAQTNGKKQEDWSQKNEVCVLVMTS